MTPQEALNSPITYSAVLYVIASLAFAWLLWWTCIAGLALVIGAWRGLDRALQKCIVGIVVYWTSIVVLTAQDYDHLFSNFVSLSFRTVALIASYFALRALVPPMAKGALRRIKEYYREVAR